MAGAADATYPGTNGRIAFGMDTGDGNFDIYTVKPDGESLHLLTTGPSADLCAAYSPDGKSIAYCSGAHGGVSEIWVMKANGTQQHQVTQTGGFVNFPDFSPDGTKLLLSGRVPSTAPPDVFVVNLDGTGLTRLTDFPGIDRFAAWSPDGSTIAFNSTRSGVEQVWLMDADGGNPRQLTSDPAAKGQTPDWSPDGTKIAFQSFATGGGDIDVINADGTGLTQITDDPAEELGPVWSPDGSEIAFLVSTPLTSTVHIMAADGSSRRAVHPGGRQAVPAWQPRSED